MDLELLSMRGQGQFDKEGSPFARFAFGVYLAAVFGYNAVTDAKPQPGATFFYLGGGDVFRMLDQSLSYLTAKDAKDAKETRLRWERGIRVPWWWRCVSAA